MSEPVLQIPFEDAFQFDPSPTFAELREHRPVARVRTLAGAEVWLVTRYDDVRMVLADPRFSRAAVVKQGAPRVALARPMPNSLTTTDPPEHTRLRKLVSSSGPGRGWRNCPRDWSRTSPPSATVRTSGNWSRCRCRSR
jgi:cytochrome P450